MQVFKPIGLVFALFAIAGIVNSAVIEDWDQEKGSVRLPSFGGQDKLRSKRSTIADPHPTSPLGEEHDNKVSKLLHFIHRKSSDIIYRKPISASRANESDSAREAEPDYDKMSDQQLFESLCEGGSLTGLCKRATKVALRKRPQDAAKIAQAIRDKPDHVDARKLLAHKLFETGIIKAEAKGYDKVVDTAINVVATKNPYVFGAVKALDLGKKLM